MEVKQVALLKPAYAIARDAPTRIPEYLVGELVDSAVEDVSFFLAEEGEEGADLHDGS